ncbi:MAG: hypothetical protein PVF70_07615 [Anaerolineales bacterium]
MASYRYPNERLVLLLTLFLVSAVIAVLEYLSGEHLHEYGETMSLWIS